MTLELSHFKVNVAEEQLRDLKERLARTRWPDEAPDNGWQYGPPVAYLKSLVAYWKNDYNWRLVEEELNQFDQFRLTVDNHHFHFIHQQSQHKQAKALLLLHGWPGSIVEFLPLIRPLTAPDNSEEAFHVIIPTLPGFGFSGPAVGWGITRAAKAFDYLMKSLGYEHYVVHGEDVGALIAREMGLIIGDALEALHLTQLFHKGEDYEQIDETNPQELNARNVHHHYQNQLAAYAILQGTRPQTLSYGLTDSPVGQLAWIIERFKDWTGGDQLTLPEDIINKEQLLTNVMIYWLNQTAGSAARYYAVGNDAWQSEVTVSTKPTAFLQMPRDISHSIKRIALQENHLFRWNTSPKGGHFAAWEQPEIVLSDLRESFHHSEYQRRLDC